MLWQILVQFTFRLAGGLAAAMALTSPKSVTAGFFRVHLWVAMGLSTFVVAVVLMLPDFPQRMGVVAIAGLAVATSYAGAVIWLYELRRPGRILLSLVAAVNLGGALFTTSESAVGWPTLAVTLDTLTAMLLLGTTFAAMLLGHWYLNTPTMKLAPLQRLIVLMGIAVVIRSIIAVGEMGMAGVPIEANSSTYFAFLALRWLAGLVGVLGLTGMTWQTLKIPNTQSATGILYVAVIFVFLGELTSQLLLAEPPHPV